MYEVVLPRRCEIRVPSKYETGEQKGVQFDELVTSKPMARRYTDGASLSKGQTHFFD
jgi:hypothetical protein